MGDSVFMKGTISVSGANRAEIVDRLKDILSLIASGMSWTFNSQGGFKLDWHQGQPPNLPPMPHYGEHGACFVCDDPIVTDQLAVVIERYGQVHYACMLHCIECAIINHSGKPNGAAK